MSDLGRRHATFVQLLSDELLELHPVFDITEPAVDDQFCKRFIRAFCFSTPCKVLKCGSYAK